MSFQPPDESATDSALLAAVTSRTLPSQLLVTWPEACQEELCQKSKASQQDVAPIAQCKLLAVDARGLLGTSASAALAVEQRAAISTDLTAGWWT